MTGPAGRYQNDLVLALSISNSGLRMWPGERETGMSTGSHLRLYDQQDQVPYQPIPARARADPNRNVRPAMFD